MKNNFVQEFGEILHSFSKPWVQIVIIIFVVLLVYLNALPNKFVLDDDTFIHWPLISDLKYIPAFFTGILPQEHLGDYRPMKGVILALNYFFWKNNPVGYILQAILIHLASVVLVYGIAKKLVKNTWTPFIAALLFGLHPVQVEAIAFITSSSDIVGIVFYLAAFYGFLLDKGNKKERKKGIWIVFSLVFFILGLLTYEMVLTLPLIITWYLLILDKKRLWETAKIIFPYLIVIVVYILMRFTVLKVSGDETYPWGSYLVGLYMALVALMRYMQLLLFPFRLQINHEVLPGIFSYRGAEIHPLTAAPTFFHPYVILALLLILTLMIIAIKVYRKYPIITFCIGWIVLALSPVLNLYPLPTLMTERYLYLASFGFALLIGWVIMTIPSLRLRPASLTVRQAGRRGRECKGELRIMRIIFTASTVFLLSYYSVRTYIRISDWRTSETLWAKEMSYSPRSLLANHNLGMAYFAKGDLEKTFKYLNYAADHNWQGIPKVHLNLGKAYLTQKDFHKAQDQFSISVIYNPWFAEGWFYLGNAERELGQFDKAESHYKKSLAVDPDFFDSRMQLSRLYVLKGDYAAGIREMEGLIRDHPRLMPAYYDLAALYIKTGDLTKAKSVLEAGLKEDPKSEVLLKTYNLLKSGY